MDDDDLLRMYDHAADVLSAAVRRDEGGIDWALGKLSLEELEDLSHCLVWMLTRVTADIERVQRDRSEAEY